VIGNKRIIKKLKNNNLKHETETLFQIKIKEIEKKIK